MRSTRPFDDPIERLVVGFDPFGKCGELRFGPRLFNRVRHSSDEDLRHSIGVGRRVNRGGFLLCNDSQMNEIVTFRWRWIDPQSFEERNRDLIFCHARSRTRHLPEDDGKIVLRSHTLRAALIEHG